jgi:hypothetical protein
MPQQYYITRTVGLMDDTLSVLWEGNELPTFRRDGSPYLFTDKHAAKRVLWRLQSKYPVTISSDTLPAIRIVYTLTYLDIDENACSYCGESDCCKQHFPAHGQSLSCLV